MDVPYCSVVEAVPPHILNRIVYKYANNQATLFNQDKNEINTSGTVNLKIVLLLQDWHI